MGKIYDAVKKFRNETMANHVASGSIDEAESAEGMSDIEIDTIPHGVAGRDLDERLVTANDPHCLAAEQFKILRSRILYPRQGHVPRSIMITSALEEEGKSLVAANLAISIAHGIREHVLLVDCDIRNPSQHVLFRVLGEKGLSDYLSGDAPLDDLLVKTVVRKLTLVPGGVPPPNPAELLSSEKMGRFMEEVKNRYDDRFTVFDATPAQITAEVSVLAKRVDGILLVIRQGHTDRDMIERTVSVLGKEKMLGVVFNGHNRFPRTYDYYKNHKYQKPRSVARR